MISIRNLNIELGDFTLKDASLEIKEREYIVIVGPSGAGKTVLLESVAGLYPVRKGEIWLRGNNVTRLKPESRHVSIVYQDYSLFPHLSVEKNIIFGLRMRKADKKRIDKALSDMVDLFNISSLLHRKPATLSGGEQQKVALARALCVSPDVLLLDEPLSSLDPGTREEIETELRHVHKELDVTILHVTHNFEEAIALGDRIAVIGDGRIMQVGPPDEIFRRPNSEFVAGFAMSRNIFQGDALIGESGENTFRTGQAVFRIDKGLKGNRATIRPEDVMLSIDDNEDGRDNHFSGVINNINDRGSTMFVDIEIPPRITALITRHTCRKLGLQPGVKVNVCLEPEFIHIFNE